MKMRKSVWALAAVLCLGMAGTGCTQKEPAEPEPEYETVGQESEDALDFLLTNATGNTITGLSVKSSAQPEYPSNMIASGQTVEADETVEFYYTPESAAGGSDAAQAEEAEETSDAEGAPAEENTSEAEDAAGEEESAPVADAQINETYSLQVTFEDGTVKEVSNFAVNDMQDADLMYEDEVVFVKYTSISAETEISTKEAELAVKADKDAAQAVDGQIQAVGEVTLESEGAIQAARAAYDALTDVQKQYAANAQLLTDQENALAALKQQAADEAAAQAAAEAAAAQSWEEQSGGYDYGYSDPGYSTSGGSSSGVSQSTDSCLGDVLINN